MVFHFRRLGGVRISIRAALTFSYRPGSGTIGKRLRGSFILRILPTSKYDIDPKRPNLGVFMAVAQSSAGQGRLTPFGNRKEDSGRHLITRFDGRRARQPRRSE